MSHPENDKFWELVQEGQEEQRYQEHLHGGEICQSGQCPYCEEEEGNDFNSDNDLQG